MSTYYCVALCSISLNLLPFSSPLSGVCGISTLIALVVVIQLEVNNATPDPPPGPGHIGGPGTPLKEHNSSCWDPKRHEWRYPTLGPKYHISSSCFGENDPNAPFYYNGMYHVQFQEHVIGGIAGGHAVSRDLIKWKLLHPTIWPDTIWDQQDVYDFSVTIVDDIPVAIEAGLTPMGNGTPFCHVMSVPSNLSDPELRVWEKVPFNPLFCGEKGAGDTPSTAWRTSWGAWRYVDGYGNVYGTASNSTFRRRVPIDIHKDIHTYTKTYIRIHAYTHTYPYFNL